MVHGFRQGEHICAIHDTEDEQLATAAAYLADGIWRGQRCLYIGADRDALLRFRAALGASGLDAAVLCERGALIELTHAETYLFGGVFSIDHLMTMLGESIRQSAVDGYTGWRGCGEMSWLLETAPEQVAGYEAMLNEFFPGTRASAMCQYNRRLLPVPVVNMALATHPTAVVAGRQRFNPFYQPGAGE